ncbi:MAG: hypothetical protein M1828_007433 [Chrysothrix sp. TS-e1954]|nr:MAG: hypothetical protein M1828_007433 [Chrysothrix sp. TS-e1954]
MSIARLIPSDPSSVTSIRQITPHIITLSAPFSRFGRIAIGGRATLVRLPSNRLAVFSPIGLTDEVRRTIDTLAADVPGERREKVGYIVAPDFEHHIFIGPWKKEFPDARVLGPEGLEEKRRGMKEMEDVRFFKTFSKQEEETLDKEGREDGRRQPSVDEEFDAAFDVEYAYGHGNKELVFNSKRDRTLIEGDLMFNLPPKEQYSKSSEDPLKGVLNRLFNGFQGTTGNALTWQKRFLWYAVSNANKPAFNRSVGRIAAWDFDRIIPCHGEVIESEGKSVFERVFSWHLDALKK